MNGSRGGRALAGDTGHTGEYAPRMENDTTQAADSDVAEELVESELLVEEISIDGMCGVY